MSHLPETFHPALYLIGVVALARRPSSLEPGLVSYESGIAQRDPSCVDLRNIFRALSIVILIG